MVTSVFLGVFFRHYLSLPLVWSDELALIMLIWSTFSGATVVFIRGEHFQVDFIVRKLHGRGGNYLKRLIQILPILFLVTLLVGSLRMMGTTWVVKSNTLPFIRTAYSYFILFVASAIMLIYSFIFASRLFKPSSRNGE